MLWESYSVSEFRLHSQNISTSYLASVWISFMLWRDIQVLDIAIGLGENENSAVLPSEIFWCKTLVVLKLCGGALVKFPNIFCLPKLKVLHIELLKVGGSDTSLRDGQGRVVDPEDAWTNAVRPRIYKVGSVEISIPSLEKLIWRPFWGMDKVVLNTPNLQVLEYDDSYSKVQSTCGFKSLLFSFISKMCNVKFLRLSGASLEVLFRSPHSLPEFHNLRRMELKASRDYQWQLLEILLHCAPNLEVLICDLEEKNHSNNVKEEVNVASTDIQRTS
ncbi:F-box/LRR-repeat protein At4g14096-like [Coffea eugenioides]|uniref:F-box/LRR-repeat protein At4g14096-like n=1 Tax=Coffea eugenioides TaxID=49369 RepID=UPI000F60C9D9|nr:F-box/LRR-repeat protein At4g14096-like [Coffea eugenioides]